jgi:hypothetical protein
MVWDGGGRDDGVKELRKNLEGGRMEGYGWVGGLGGWGG